MITGEVEARVDLQADQLAGGTDEGPAAARWRTLVTGRLEEMERLEPGRGSLRGAFWDRRADRFDASVRAADTEADPFLRRLRRVTEPSSTAIDVGGGTGRFALPLARGIEHVTVVDLSAGMLDVLRRRADEAGVANLTAIHSPWADADAPIADVAFSAFVLTLVSDAPAFVAKLEAAARRHVFLYLGAYTGDAVFDPVWRHFHGVPRAPGATYLDALAVLREMGIEPDVKVVELPNRKRFETVDKAVEHYRDWLLLGDGPEVADELRGLLAVWLLGRKGSLRSPLRSIPAAILHWTPRAR